jgi:hypothetical protein
MTMDRLLKVVVFAITIWSILETMDVPWRLTYKRFMFLQTWTLAAHMQRVSLNYYTDYREEIEA